MKMKMKSSAKWYPVLVMIVIDLAFAISNILLKKIVDHGINRLVFITYRQSVSAIFLSPLALFLERKNRPKLTFAILCYLFVSAIIGASATQYLFLLGIEYTSATFSCAFLNMIPVVTFLMTTICLEKINVKHNSGRAKVLGALVCLGGSIVLTVYKGIPLFHFEGSEHVNQSMERHMKLNSHVWKERWVIGSMALFAGTLCLSSWYLLQTSIGKRYPCQYSSTAVMTCFSAIQSAILSSSIDQELSNWILRRRSDILIILYAGMVGSGLCFVGISWCVKKRGPVFTAAFSPLVTIMAAMFNVPVLHEQLYLGSVVGSVTVIAGLYILLWGKDKELQEQDTKLVAETDERKEPKPGFQTVKISSELVQPQ
ncbi:hypothetical protein OROMI_009568 [Orobanche minor]